MKELPLFAFFISLSFASSALPAEKDHSTESVITKKAVSYYRNQGLLETFATPNSSKILIGFSPFKIERVYMFKNNMWGIRTKKAPESLSIDAIKQLLYLSGVDDSISLSENDKLAAYEMIKKLLTNHGAAFLATGYNLNVEKLISHKEVNSDYCSSFRKGLKLIDEDFKQPTLYCEMSSSVSNVYYLSTPNESSFQITYHESKGNGRLQISYIENGRVQKPIVLDGI